MKKLSLLPIIILLTINSCTKEENKTIITIFHAGSLISPLKELTKEYKKKNKNIEFYLEASGSLAAIRKHTELGKYADIIASADYEAIKKMMFPEYAEWVLAFASNEMVIGYSNLSKYKEEINSKNWYKILLKKGVEYGHSDPNLDPCGYRTLMVWKLAELYYKEKGLYQKLKDKINPRNIRPKAVELIPLVQTGALDYIFEYKSIAKNHKIQYIKLPDEINLSNPEYRNFYRKISVKILKTKKEYMVLNGETILYGITITKASKNKEIAYDFIKFIISKKGKEILKELGFKVITPFLEGPNLKYAKEKLKL